MVGNSFPWNGGSKWETNQRTAIEVTFTTPICEIGVESVPNNLVFLPGDRMGQIYQADRRCVGPAKNLFYKFVQWIII